MAGRVALLDAAFEELVERGPALPADAVARRAGASKALVFHHFGSREGLLDAMAARVLAQTQEGLASLVDEYPDPARRLAALARALLEDPGETPRAHARRILLFWLQDDASGECRGALRDALLSDYVAALVREGVATGAMRAGTDAAEAARVLLARWHGVTALHAAGTAVDFEAEAERLVADLDRLAGRAPTP